MALERFRKMADKRRRDDEGQFADEKDPFAILELIGTQGDWCEPLTATEVANELDWARRTALNKLQTLGERGILASKKVGGRARVWWLHPQVRGAYTLLLHAETVSKQTLVDAAWDAAPETGRAETKRILWQTVVQPALTALGGQPTGEGGRWILDES